MKIRGLFSFAALALAASLPAPAQNSTGTSPAPVGRVAHHFVARLMMSADLSSSVLVSYLTFQDGISNSPFDPSGPPSEQTAYITAFADPASMGAPIVNGNIQAALPSVTTAKFYLNTKPSGRSWDKPETFQTGQLIAVARYSITQAVFLGPIAVATWSFDWADTRDFTFLDGKTYNLGKMYPNGLTGVNYINTSPVPTTNPDYPAALAGAGSEYAVGR